MNPSEITQQYDFTGKTIAITGGAGILGGEMACALAELHANIAILDLKTQPAERLLPRLQSGKGKTILVETNVLDVNSLRQAAEQIEKEIGPVDILINGAGGNKPQATTSAELSFFDLPADALKWVFDLNLLGTMLPSQVFGKKMAERGQGNILNISSMSAYLPLTRIAAYSAAKAGVTNFTQWLAVHMAQEYSARIRVNAIAPGFLITTQNQFLLTEEKTGELTERGRQVIYKTPMKRFGIPQDLIGTVLFLLSPASEFITGVVIPIDGGFSAFSGV